MRTRHKSGTPRSLSALDTAETTASSASRALRREESSLSAATDVRRRLPSQDHDRNTRLQQTASRRHVLSRVSVLRRSVTVTWTQRGAVSQK